MCNTFCSLINSVSAAYQTGKEDGRKAKKREVADNLIKKSISMNFVSPADPFVDALGQPDGNIQ
jgi:hypothetical protein